MNTPARVIFDRSIFHKERFDALTKSPLSLAIRNGQVKLLYTSIFIEETLMFSQKRPQEFLDQWRFIVSLNRSHWFKTSQRIFPYELSRRIRSNDFYLLKPSQIETIIARAPRLTEKNISGNDMKKTLEHVDRNYELRDDERSRRLALRYDNPQTNSNFETEFERFAEKFLQVGIMSRYRHSRGYLTVWREHRSDLKFTDMYLRSWFSTRFLPVVDHKLKVHKNDRVDAEQLAYLIWADIFVSDDLGIILPAFKLLYPNDDKTLYSSDQFIAFLNTLSVV